MDPTISHQRFLLPTSAHWKVQTAQYNEAEFAFFDALVKFDFSPTGAFVAVDTLSSQGEP